MTGGKFIFRPRTTTICMPESWPCIPKLRAENRHQVLATICTKAATEASHLQAAVSCDENLASGPAWLVQLDTSQSSPGHQTAELVYNGTSSQFPFLCRAAFGLTGTAAPFMTKKVRLAPQVLSPQMHKELWVAGWPWWTVCAHVVLSRMQAVKMCSTGLELSKASS